MIPRPDGLGLVYHLCSDPSFFDKATTYGLCDETVTDPRIINAMDPVDALQFANAFHRQLVFRSATDSTASTASIEPFAPDNDILAACETLDASAMLEATRNYCEAVKGRCNNDGACIEIGIVPTSAAVDELVPALNDIYGVLQDEDLCVPEQWGLSFACPVASCAQPPSGCDYGLARYVLNNVRDCCAVLCYATDSNGNECSGAIRVLGAWTSSPSSSWLLLIALIFLAFRHH